MKRRILITVGSLGLLAGLWMLTWNQYQESKSVPSKEEQGKTTERPFRHKRLPANGQLPSPIKKDLVHIKKSQIAVTNDLAISKKSIFTQGQSKFALVNNLSVVSNSERSSYSKEEIISEKFNKLIVTKAPEASDSGRVVHNQRTKRLAILTGVLKIKLNNHSQWSDIQEEFDLSLEGNFPGIRLTLLKTTDIDNIEAMLKSLSSDSRVERVELEILESPIQVK